MLLAAICVYFRILTFGCAKTVAVSSTVRCAV